MSTLISCLNTQCDHICKYLAKHLLYYKHLIVVNLMVLLIKNGIINGIINNSTLF